MPQARVLLTERRHVQEERANLLARDRAARVQAEEAEERLNVVLKSVGDAICAVDHEFRFTYANDRFRQLIHSLPHHPAAEIIGRSLWETVPQLAATRFSQELREVVSSQIPRHFEEFYPLGRLVRDSRLPNRRRNDDLSAGYYPAEAGQGTLGGRARPSPGDYHLLAGGDSPG